MRGGGSSFGHGHMLAAMCKEGVLVSVTRVKELL
jgi:hypothetical protein